MIQVQKWATDWLLRQRGILVGLEILLVALVAVQSARLVWILAEPALPLGSAGFASAPLSDAELASLTRTNPFVPRLADPAGQAPAGDSPALNLFGVRTAGPDGGSAIIGMPGATQAVHAVGEEVTPGTVLTSVAADHAVLSRAGHTFELWLADSAPPQGSTAAVPSYLTAPRRIVPAARATPIAIDPQKFLAETGLRPRTENGRVTGYTVLPRGSAETLRQVGLEAGDVLVGLNGTPISPERYSELESELVSGSQAEITIQRGSETRTITLQTGR